MFAYCLNNPVCYADDAGSAAKINFDHSMNVEQSPWREDSPGGGGYPSNHYLSRNTYGSGSDKFLIIKLLKFLFNSDEQTVIDAECFAFYKGQLVVKQEWAISDGRSASFGIMFLHVDERDPRTVKHEWGHYVQLWQMGLPGYIVNVAIPSYTSDGSDPYYYSNPWERMADFWGGVYRDSGYRDGALAWGFSQYILGPLSVPLFYYFTE